MEQSELVIHNDRDIMGGTPACLGTRAPFARRLDRLEADQPLAEFLEDFPKVGRRVS